MMSIHQANLGALSGGIKPNCGPTAVANLMGWKTSAVMDIFRKEFDYGPRWQGRTTLTRCVKVLAWQRKSLKSMGNEQGEIRRKMSLKNFVEMHCKSQGRYMIRVGGHLVAVIDHVVYDQHEIAPIAESKCARKMVSHAFEIK
jgi:hypothetical protein